MRWMRKAIAGPRMVVDGGEFASSITFVIDQSCKNGLLACLRMCGSTHGHNERIARLLVPDEVVVADCDVQIAPCELCGCPDESRDLATVSGAQ